MFDVSSAVQIGVKFKTTSLTPEFQSISIIFRDTVTPATNLESIVLYAHSIFFGCDNYLRLQTDVSSEMSIKP